jgi:hypothetical protein
MHQFGVKFERFLGASILFIYLLASVIGAAMFFGANAIPEWAAQIIEAFRPWVLGVAFEGQTMLTARHVSGNIRQLRSPVLEAEVRKRVLWDMWLHILLLAGLAVFSFWNQLNYLLATWTPPTTNAIDIPVWAQYVIQAAALPILSLAAAFLAPAALSTAERMVEEAGKTLEQFIDVLKKQRNRTISKVEAIDVDMSAAVLQVAAAAGDKKAGAMIASVQSALVGLVTSDGQPVTVPVVTPEKAAPNGSVESRARAAYRHNMTWQELEKKAKISSSSAKRYVKKFKKERGLGQAVPPTVRRLPRAS